MLRKHKKEDMLKTIEKINSRISYSVALLTVLVTGWQEDSRRKLVLLLLTWLLLQQNPSPGGPNVAPNIQKCRSYSTTRHWWNKVRELESYLLAGFQGQGIILGLPALLLFMNLPGTHIQQLPKSGLEHLLYYQLALGRHMELHLSKMKSAGKAAP